MMRDRRSLTAQIDEISKTLEERRRTAKAAPNPSLAEYRIKTLTDIFDTLSWLQRHADELREFVKRQDPPPG